MNKLAVIFTMVVIVLLGMVPVGSVYFYNRGYQAATPKTPVPSPTVSALSYTLADLKTLKTAPMTMKVRRLSPSEFTTDITIEKWTGDDLVIAVPNYNPTKETGLIANRYNRITLINGKGIVAQYSTGDDDVTDVQLLPDKMVVKTRNGIGEISYAGDFLWGMSVNKISHSAELLPNGNYLIMRGDYDQAVELTKDGKIAWEWNALEGIPPYNANTFVGWGDRTELTYNIYQQFRMTTPKGDIWTHANRVQKLSDGYLISLRNLNLVLKVGFDKKIEWTFGSLLIKYQHYPTLLPNGNIMVYDNGNGRVVEFTRTGDVVWQYPIYAAVWGDLEKLGNGDYVFPSAFEGTIYEVSPSKEVIKKVQMGKMPLMHAYSTDALKWIGAN